MHPNQAARSIWRGKGGGQGFGQAPKLPLGRSPSAGEGPAPPSRPHLLQLPPGGTLQPRASAAPCIKVTATRIALEQQFYYETENETQRLPWHATKHLKQITSETVVSQIENASYKTRHTNPNQKLE